MKNADPGSSRRRSAFEGEMRAVLVVYASRRGGSYLAYSGALAQPSVTARSHRRKLAFGCPAGRDVVGGAVFGGCGCQERPAGSSGSGTSSPCAACMLADDPEVVLGCQLTITGHQIDSMIGEMPPAAASRPFGGCAPCRPGASRKASANLAREGRVDH
jgi:hypothetical protein